MISLSVYFITCFVLFHASPTVVAVEDCEAECVVRDCVQLQAALNSENVTKVVIASQIDCSRDNWQVAVIVQRNVEITSAPVPAPPPAQSQNSTAIATESERPFVDWGDLGNVVIVERAALNVHDLLMKQADFGKGGLSLAFVHTRKGATAVFTGVVVVAETCSESARLYRETLEDSSRPDFLVGEQRVVSIGSNVLLVQDVAVWWPILKAVWQLCNGFLVCAREREEQIDVDQYFESRFVKDSCEVDPELEMNAETIADSLNLTVNMDEEMDDGGDSDSGLSRATTTVFIVIAVIAAVLFITALFSYKCIVTPRTQRLKYPHRRRDHGSTGMPDDSDITSSRHLNNKNDVDLDLFGCGTNVPLQDVVIGSLLGRGGFGKVYKGTWKGTTVAIKVIEHGERLLQNELKLPFEAYLSRHISHPNVVQTFLIHTRQKDSANGITVDTLDLQADSPESAKKNASVASMDVFSNMGPNSTHGRDAGELFETWLVLEFCDRGSLSRAIRKGELLTKDSGAPLLDHILLSALDVANAMNYLHSLGITHGDLKAENVLLKSASTDRRGFFCKVTDFGLSRYVGNDDYLQTFTYGTITHMPPELLKDGAFSRAVDIYSFGVLLWELLATTPPYPDTNHGHILVTVVNEGRRPRLTERYPQMYADLIRDCWKQNAHDRPTFSTIVQRLKKMLADLELSNALMKSDEQPPTESASHLSPSLTSGDVHTRPLMTSMSSNQSSGSDSASRRNRVVFASEKASSIPHHHHHDVQAESTNRNQSQIYSTDSDDASLSGTSTRSLSSSTFSNFHDK